MHMKLELLTVLGLALGMIACGRGDKSVAAENEGIPNLVLRTEEANKALVRGDIDRYIALTQHAEDYTLMAPFGGDTDARLRRVRREPCKNGELFKSGTLDQEVVATYNSGDLAVLVTIERVQAEIADLPEQNWSLRVTQVFRREDTGWRLVHRHADPLVNGISLEEAAALTRRNSN
jgi:ketosteroid isomerase-like protein